MIVTPFGDLAYGSKSGLSNWMQAHDTRHQAENQYIAYKFGVVLPRNDLLADEPNEDWLFNHMSMHGSLIKFVLPDQSVSPTLLEMPWRNADDFYMWHDQHNRMHSMLDQQLGIQ